MVSTPQMGPKMCKSSIKLTTPSFLGGFEILEGINDHPRCWGNCLVKSKILKYEVSPDAPKKKSSRRVGIWTWRRCFFSCLWILYRLAFCNGFHVVWSICVSIRLVLWCFCALAIKYGHFIPGKVFLFWWVISQSDSGAMVLACESGYGYLCCVREVHNVVESLEAKEVNTPTREVKIVPTTPSVVHLYRHHHHPSSSPSPGQLCSLQISFRHRESVESGWLHWISLNSPDSDSIKVDWAVEILLDPPRKKSRKFRDWWFWYQDTPREKATEMGTKRMKPDLGVTYSQKKNQMGVDQNICQCISIPCVFSLKQQLINGFFIPPFGRNRVLDPSPDLAPLWLRQPISSRARFRGMEDAKSKKDHFSTIFRVCHDHGLTNLW